MTTGMYITTAICLTVLSLAWAFVYLATHMPPKDK